MFGKFKGWFSGLSKAGKVGVISGAVILSLAGIGAASPQKHDQTAVQGTSTTSKSTITHKTVTAAESIPFESQTVDDSSLANGTNQTQTEGVNGVKTKTYDVILTDGVETSRTLTKEEVTTQPVTKVIQHGTYVAPQPAASAYRVGATCVDGSPSSATGSGACSHHHGVSCWQYSDGTCRSY